MRKGHSVRFCKIRKKFVPKGILSGFPRILRSLTIKLTSMDPNLLGDQILPPDFNFCRISWWKTNTYGTWTVVAPSTWLEMHQSLSTSLLSRKAMWPMEIITKERSLENVLLVMKTIFYVEGLKHNLFSITQLCDKGYVVIFKTNSCEICLPNSKEVLLVGKRINNVYLLDISNSRSIGCLLSKHEESWL